ncbi:MAG: YggS family pyridoxal phosphate-dependent enzyme [Acidobacteria bacterium]|nr:MAG: YggS family pyridoxal phosphate-dependent enzyme [Acidobacteriota bacterium]
MPEVAQATATIFERVAAVRRRIEASVQRAARTPAEIKLIAVTKTHPAEIVREALNAGLTDFGENRVQEAEAKIAQLADGAARWHLIGHLQANKVRRAVKLFDVIHSIDSTTLVARLERLCAEEERRVLPVLLQIDLAGEATKSGADVAALPEMIEECQRCAHVRLVGLMTLPPYFDDAEQVRPYFRRLRELRDEWQRRGAFGASVGDLSMGMTHDFEVAIAEGATMVRVGTALFGARG